MRILAGRYKGKQLSAGPDLTIRPMTNRNKEIIFASLDDFFSNGKVLDLFCGSGNLGLEALSRGAAQITFVEQEKSALSILKKNINALRVDSQLVRIEDCDVLSFFKMEKTSYRLIFADPPFKYDSLQKLTDMVFIHNILEKDGIMVLHHEKTTLLKETSSLYTILMQKKTGRSLITFLAREHAYV
jgi:16S rRNA (guanine966-N2)-methyltransferase